MSAIHCLASTNRLLRWRATPLATLALCAAIPATGFCAEVNTQAVSDQATSATALLSGAKTTEQEYSVTTGFRLSQNTIQLDTLLGRTSPVNTFIVDSGAPMTIAAPLIRELGLKPLASIGLAGPEGGHTSVGVVAIPEVTIAGLTVRDVGAVVDWVEPPDALACLSTSGLLGASLLQTAIWQIDFQTKQITMTNSLATLRGLNDAIKIPFTRSDAAGSPRISVGVSGSADVSLLIDLGFNGSIAIPTPTLESAGDHIADSAPTEVGQASTTVFGAKPSTVRIARVKELRVGSLHLANFPVVTGTSVSDFHVGIDFLRHFRVTLDWLNDDLYLEPIEPQSALYDNFPTYGFAPQVHEGGLVVGALWRGSSGELAGLALGDRIVEIDGQDTTTPDFESLCGILNSVSLYGSNSAPIAVTLLRDGERKTVRIARTPLLTDALSTGNDEAGR